MAAYTPSTRGYRIYVVEPSQNQIMRYQPTLDGSAFTPSDYLITQSDEVADFRQLYVDFDVYALVEDGVQPLRARSSTTASS